MKTNPLHSLFVGEVTNASYQHVANLRIRFKWLTSATKFGEQAGIPYSRCQCHEASYNGIKSDFGRPLKERSIKEINRLTLFASSVNGAEGENTESV